MPRIVMAEMRRLEDTRDREFDLRFWQAQTSSERLIAAWELVETYLKLHGRTDESRLQRSVAVLQQK